jgi:hypothetical protein
MALLNEAITKHLFKMQSFVYLIASHINEYFVSLLDFYLSSSLECNLYNSRNRIYFVYNCKLKSMEWASERIILQMELSEKAILGK